MIKNGIKIILKKYGKRKINISSKLLMIYISSNMIYICIYIYIYISYPSIAVVFLCACFFSLLH